MEVAMPRFLWAALAALLVFGCAATIQQMQGDHEHVECYRSE